MSYIAQNIVIIVTRSRFSRPNPVLGQKTLGDNKDVVSDTHCQLFNDGLKMCLAQNYHLSAVQCFITVQATS